MSDVEAIDLVTFYIIIDDIVFSDGRTAMAMLGGGGPQTAFGMKLWADKVGLVAGVGSDLLPAVPDWLAGMGIDINGLRYANEWPTLRAWQLLEEDGHRTQVWRVPGPAIGQHLARSLETLPPTYLEARGFHLGIHPEEPDLDFVKDLRTGGATVSLEPYRPPTRPLSPAELQALVAAGQIFSPNLEEAQALVGSGKPLDLIRRFTAAGAEIVALRQGPAGATVHRADTGETWHIPAVETTVVDPTGAGNAFCGGFLAGWVLTGEIRQAGLYGTVAASFLVEQVGLPEPRSELFDEAKQRLARLEARARPIMSGHE